MNKLKLAELQKLYEQDVSATLKSSMRLTNGKSAKTTDNVCPHV